MCDQSDKPFTNDLLDTLDELHKQVELMKNCHNCKHYYYCCKGFHPARMLCTRSLKLLPGMPLPTHVECGDFWELKVSESDTKDII